MQSAALLASGPQAAPRLGAARRAVRRCCPQRPQAFVQAANKELQSAAASLVLTTAFLGTPVGLAFAEEAAAPDAAADVAAAAAGGIPVPELVLVLSPIVLYGIFNVYRSQVDPRAKLSDFLFAAAATAIVGNILSIIIFKRRFF